ncbi:MAG TPA: hypothetical protein VKV40_22560 [Ktedonobacteraceae bacterium]|nr:hypothetical protein [Ktedonobacteraceae bacterium]
MADQQQDDYIPYDPTTAITLEDYDTIHKEKEQFQQLLLQARGEFMYQHYNRLLRALEVSLERAAKVKVRLERQERRKVAKEHHEQLQQQREQARLERLQERLKRV